MIIRIEIGLFSQKNIDSLIKESVFALLNWKELIENPTPKSITSTIKPVVLGA